jgi:hypothetical protein
VIAPNKASITLPPLTRNDLPIANRIGPDGRSFPLTCYLIDGT